MITLKQILLQICPRDWFMSLNLKDAYFHIQVAPPSQTIFEIRIRRGGGVSVAKFVGRKKADRVGS